LTKTATLWDCSNCTLAGSENERREKMACKMLDGEKRAAEIKEELKKELAELAARGVKPHLVAVQVGENKASEVYIRSQQKAFSELGIDYTLKTLPGDITKDALVKEIEALNGDGTYTGIILQMPLPQQINAREIQACISPDKDVEAINARNMGKLVAGDLTLGPCTAAAAMELYKTTGEPLKGKDVVVVGHSEIVGKPLALMLLWHPTESATPTVCHIATKDLKAHLKRADVVFVAVGKAGLVNGADLKPGAIAIDIGINRVPVKDKDGNPVLNEKGKPKMKTVGDIDAESAEKVCSWLSPVPGGVGPITVVMLMRNTVRLAGMAGG